MNKNLQELQNKFKAQKAMEIMEMNQTNNSSLAIEEVSKGEGFITRLAQKAWDKKEYILSSLLLLVFMIYFVDTAIDYLFLEEVIFEDVEQL